MPGHLEPMLQLHTRLRYKVVFTFQVPPPPPLNPQAYAGISQGLTAFCFLISEFCPISKENVHKPGLGGRGWVQLTSEY